MTRPPPLGPARSWGPPPWLWLTLALFLAQLPALIGHALGAGTGLGRFGEAARGRFVTAVLGLVQLLPQFFLLAAVLALLAPRARCRRVERRYGLLAPDDPLMAPPAAVPGSRDGSAEPHFAAAMTEFVHAHAPGTRLRLSTLDGLSARVYPGGRRTTRIGVFAPLVHLWHTDIEAARAVLLHELGHLRRGEQHVTGLGSPLTALVRVWPYVLAGFVVLPVTLLFVTGNATAVLTLAEVVLVLQSVPKVLLLVVAALWSAELAADRFAARAAGADTVVRALRSLEKGDRGGLARLYHPPVRMRVWCVSRAGTTRVELLSTLLWPLALLAQLLLTTLGAFPAYVLLGASGDRAARQVLALAHESLAGQPAWWATLAVALVWPSATRVRRARGDRSATVRSERARPVSARPALARPTTVGPELVRPAPARSAVVYAAAVLLPAVLLLLGLLPLASRPAGESSPMNRRCRPPRSRGYRALVEPEPVAEPEPEPEPRTVPEPAPGPGPGSGSGSGRRRRAPAVPRRVIRAVRRGSRPSRPGSRRRPAATRITHGDHAPSARSVSHPPIPSREPAPRPRRWPTACAGPAGHCATTARWRPTWPRSRSCARRPSTPRHAC